MSEFAYAKYGLRPPVYALAALGALVGLAIAANSASLGILSDWEKASFQFFYNWPDWLKPLFLAVTQLGSAWMLLIVPLAALAQRHKALAKRMLASGLVAFILMEWLKYLVDRPRPAELLSGYTPKEALVIGNGFPSGHTAIATALALTLLPYLPKKHWWLIGAWIVGVAVSRVYLGVHAPLDIFGGLAIGVLVASIGHLWTARSTFRGKFEKLKKHSK